MVTKKSLNQIYFLNKELEYWVKKKCEAEYGLKSPVLGKDYKTYTVSNPAEEEAIKRLHIAEQIERILTGIQEERLKVYEAIETINDSLLRQIIEHRCVQLCSWQGVANILGYGTADSIRKIYDRAFTKKGALDKKYLK